MPYSMGQESEAAQKKIDFAGYQVNSELIGLANKGAVFLHCLPRKPEEVTDDVSDHQQLSFHSQLECSRADSRFDYAHLVGEQIVGSINYLLDLHTLRAIRDALHIIVLFASIAHRFCFLPDSDTLFHPL